MILATMVEVGDYVIMSEDSDFDKVGFLKRESLREVVSEDDVGDDREEQ